MGKRANPAIVGAFVVGAVVLAVFAVALFGSGRMFRTSYQYVLFFTGDVNGLKPGAPVKLKGVEVGRVVSVLLNVSARNLFQNAAQTGSFSQLRIPVLIELDDNAFTQRGGHLTPDPATIKKLVEFGLRGRLSMESFVTGVLYIEFDMLPDAPIKYFADDTVTYSEIPTLLTPLEEVQMQASKFLTHLEGIDFKGLIDSLAHTAAGLDRLVNSPSLEQALGGLPETMKKVDLTLAEATSTIASFRQLSKDIDQQVAPTMQSVRNTAEQAGQALLTATTTLEKVTYVIEPESVLMHQLSQSLDDLSSAAVAVRRLAEELDRNPSVLLRGKYVSEESK